MDAWGEYHRAVLDQANELLEQSQRPGAVVCTCNDWIGPREICSTTLRCGARKSRITLLQNGRIVIEQK
jgi:hypothetical protein